MLCGQSKVFAADKENSDKHNVKQEQQSSHYRSKHKSYRPSGEEIEKKVEKIEEAKKLLEDLSSKQVSAHETKEGLNASFQTVKQAQTVLGTLESELKEMLEKYFSSVSSSEGDEHLSSHTISKQNGNTAPHKVKTKDLTKAKVELEKLVTRYKEVNKKIERNPGDPRLQKKLDEAASNVESAEHRLRKLEVAYNQERQQQVPEVQQVRVPLASVNPSSPVSSSAISTVTLSSVISSSPVVKATQEVDKPLTKSSSSKMSVTADSTSNISTTTTTTTTTTTQDSSIKQAPPVPQKPQKLSVPLSTSVTSSKSNNFDSDEGWGDDGWDAPHPNSSAVELGMKQDFLGQGQLLFSSVLNGTYFSNTISESGEREQSSGSSSASSHQDGRLVDSSSSCSLSLYQGGDPGDSFDTAKAKLEVFMQKRHEPPQQPTKKPIGPRDEPSNAFKEAQSKLGAFLKKEEGWSAQSLKEPLKPTGRQSEDYKKNRAAMELLFAGVIAQHQDIQDYQRGSSSSPLSLSSSSSLVENYEQGRQKWLKLKEELEKGERVYEGMYGFFQISNQNEELRAKLFAMHKKNESLKSELESLGQELEDMWHKGLVEDSSDIDIDTDTDDSEGSVSDSADEFDDEFDDSDFEDDFDDSSSDITSYTSDAQDSSSDLDSSDSSSDLGSEGDWSEFIVTSSGSGNPPGNMAPAPGFGANNIQGQEDSRQLLLETVRDFLNLLVYQDKDKKPTQPPPGYNVIANQGSVKGLSYVIHGAIQEVQNAMRVLALNMNTARLTSEKPFRIFGSLSGQASSQKNSGASAQAGVMYAIPTLPKLWVGTAISQGRERKKEYQGVDIPKAYGGAKAKTETNQASVIAAWNVAEPGLMGYVEGTFGWGEAKNTRVFTHAGERITTKGAAHTSTNGGIARVGYNIEITPMMMLTPYAEVSIATARWDSYKESGRILPAKISATKEHVIEHRAGLKGNWHISDVCKIQGWGAVISGERNNTGVTARLTPLYSVSISSGKDKSRYKQLEVGSNIDFKITHNCGVGVNAEVRTKDGEKDKGIKPQSMGIHFWYDF